MFLTALIPQRWPYAPVGAVIRVVPASRFAGDWGGRWDFTARVAYINADLPPDVVPGVCAHELAHGRWSAPLPNLDGEEGSAGLALEMFDELRVERFALAHSPDIRDDVRAWLNHNLPETLEIPNPRGAALAYGNIVGRSLTGAFTNAEVASIVVEFQDRMGPRWTDALDIHLCDALEAPPGATGTLIRLARTWDRTATNPPV